jgi:hypothetical protein
MSFLDCLGAAVNSSAAILQEGDRRMQRQLAGRDGPVSAAQRGSRLEQQVRQTMQERRAGDLDERGFGAGLPAFQERDKAAESTVSSISAPASRSRSRRCPRKDGCPQESPTKRTVDAVVPRLARRTRGCDARYRPILLKNSKSQARQNSVGYRGNQ